jgi:hypothetical protein
MMTFPLDFKTFTSEILPLASIRICRVQTKDFAESKIDVG